MYRRLLTRWYHKIEKDHAAIQQLAHDWALFEKRQTYLTSREHSFFFNALKSHRPSSFPFFIRLLLDETHKRMLEEQKIQASQLEECLNTYNATFVEQRLRDYRSLFDGADDHLRAALDPEQRQAIVVDDLHNLLVAAAGSGKTSVLTTRIAYLVRRTDAVAPAKILALAFNRSAAKEMKERLKKNFHIDLEVTTFHAFGYRILKENGVQGREVQETEKLVDVLFSQLIQSSQRLERLFIEYLCKYLQDELQEVDFQTKEEYYQYMRSQRYLTLSGIQVKSLAEKEIANFFFMHGIACEYERQVPWLSQRYRPDFYLPEFDITIEHWGLDRNGQTAPWIDAQRYRQTRLWKLEQFRVRRKILVETWDYERSEGTLIEHLKQSLQEVCPAQQFHPLSYTDLVHKVYARQQDRAREVKKLIATLIAHAKSHFLTPEQLEHRLLTLSIKPKTRHFGEMALLVYQEYERYRDENQWIDFNDMINQAIDQIRAKPERYAQRYEHILIDEFQDISHQRLTLIKCLVNENTTTKLFCVGDDWQSIYQFAGSDVSFFVDFEASFTQPAVNFLSTNYRSASNIVEASAHLIAFNRYQREKQVRAVNTAKGPIRVFLLPQGQTLHAFSIAQAQHVFVTIQGLLKQGIRPQEIMVISRFTKPLRDLERLFQQDGDRRTYNNIRCLSVHKSKGSEASHVFLLSVISGVFGFPSEMHDDSVLEIVTPGRTRATIFEEERRLFYVALTRAKEHLYIYTQKGAESLFLHEIAPYCENQSI
jgi:DNA helicase-4